jgi:hypothetical protein
MGPSRTYHVTSMLDHSHCQGRQAVPALEGDQLYGTSNSLTAWLPNEKRVEGADWTNGEQGRYLDS